MTIAIVLLFIIIIVVYHPYLERERNSYLLYLKNSRKEEKNRYREKDIDY